MRYLKAALCIVGVSMALSAGYRDDPRVQEIIREYGHVESMSKSGMFPYSKRGGEYDGEVDIAYLYRDNRYRQPPRKLKLEGGTGDSAHDAEYYYRLDGTLFFSYLRSANVRGCRTEVRSYFDHAGERIYRKEKHGTCAAIIGYKEIVRDPIQEFSKH